MPSKQSDSTPGEKLLALYTLLILRGEKEISLTELTKALECSKQTVLRLLTQLEASGYGKLAEPIVKGREHFYRLLQTHDPYLALGAKELAQLTLCRKMLMHILPKGVADLFGEESKTEDKKGSEEIGLVYSKGYIDYGPHQEHYALLIRCIQENLVCQLTYRRALPDVKRTFYFAPKRVIVFRESISFLGWEISETDPVAKIYDNPLTLLLQRCLDVQLTKRSSEQIVVEPTENQNLARPFGFMTGDIFTVKVQFFSHAVAYVYDRQWSNKQKTTVHDDGSLTLEFDAQSAAEVISWLLAFGDKAYVLEPEWLREAVLKEHRAAARAYTKAKKMEQQAKDSQEAKDIDE
ncbi:MAG: WYL domain-containing protein [Desulfovibrionaceae bacterium]|nr:WYL domain-containing protein [Desulfovibrionaceae bacterium]